MFFLQMGLRVVKEYLAFPLRPCEVKLLTSSIGLFWMINGQVNVVNPVVWAICEVRQFTLASVEVMRQKADVIGNVQVL